MMVFYFIFLALFAISLIVSMVYKTYAVTRITDEISAHQTISVIVPFRNEAGNIPRLIQSLKSQKIKPLEILFVDDHSTDDGRDQLVHAFEQENGVRIYVLPEELEGKKHAIFYGVQHASGTHCLTLDADVTFGPHFFEALMNLSAGDMDVLPVVMSSRSFLGRLFSFEYLFFNAFNFVFSTFYISSASGANLLFSRQKYLAWSELNNHAHLASGDDHFLLRNFQTEKAIITVSNEAEKSVNTYSVESWREYFIQRLRWLSKMKHKSNGWDKLLGLLFGTYFLGTFVVFIVLVIAGDFNKLVALIALRLLIDLMVFSHYAVKLNILKTFWVYPLFFTFYPVVFCSIFLGALLFRPKWKGREVIKIE